MMNNNPLNLRIFIPPAREATRSVACWRCIEPGQLHCWPHGAFGNNRRARSRAVLPSTDESPSDTGRELVVRPQMLMTQEVFAELQKCLVYDGKECGGILLGPVGNDHLVTHFIFDESAKTTSTTYSFSAKHLNEKCRDYKRFNLEAKGAGHCHPGGMTWPSGGDLAYANRIFFGGKNPHAQLFLMPIVVQQRLYPWIVYRQEPNMAISADLILV